MVIILQYLKNYKFNQFQTKNDVGLLHFFNFKLPNNSFSKKKLSILSFFLNDFIEMQLRL